MEDRKRKRNKKGYIHRSPAVCIVVHDLGGQPISNGTAEKIVDAVFEVTQKERLAINFTRI